MTRYTFRGVRGWVSGGVCGICGRTYTEKVCPYCSAIHSSQRA